jgi:predicted aconitase with swiveling domain
MQGRVLVAGEARGLLLVSPEPLSFWGGYDYKTGEIIDRRHPLSGETATGRVLALPLTRGSSTTTAVLLESIKAGTAPAAILSPRVDSFLVLASVVADEMYGSPIPLLALSDEDFRSLRSGQQVEIRRDGEVRLV